MKDPLRVPFEAAEPDLAGPRLIHEAGGEDRKPVPSICTVLHEARLRGGYSVADAARVLRIQEHYLQALEDGRFDEIPGATYTIGFLRSYSGFLGLEPDEIIEAFKRERGLDGGEQRLAFPSPTRDSPRPKLWLILLVLVLAGLAYGGWQYQSTDGQIATDLVADVSTRLTEAVGLGEAEGPQGEVAAGARATATPEPAPPVTDVASAAPAPVESAVAAPEPEAAPAPAVPEASQEPAPAEPVATAPVEPAPASAAPAPEPAASATEEPLEGVPAAENWSETDAPPAAGTETDAAAVEASAIESEPVTPPPAKVEAVSAVAADEPVDPASLAPPSYPGQPSTATDTTATTATTEGAEASEASGTAAQSESQHSVMVAPLDVASASAGGPASGEARESNAAAPEPAVEAPGQQSAGLSDSGDSGGATLAPAPDTGYVPKVYGRSNLDARVVITALDDSWVQVQGPDNELLLTRILHTGDSYRVPDRPGLVMVTGNAGGLEVRVDDATAPALGPVGVVLRNIALEPERLLAGTATAR